MPLVNYSSELPVTWQPQCKLCKLATSHPEVFKDVHQQILENGMSMAKAVPYLNNIIENQHLDLVQFNHGNILAHFQNHISLPERISIELSGKGPVTLKDVSPEIGTYVEDMVRRKVGNEVADYFNLEQIRVRLTEKLDMLDAMMLNEQTKDPEQVDINKLKVYSRMAGEIRCCIVDINKIRQSKQMLNIIIKSLIEKYTFDIAKQLVREYDQLNQDLRDAGLSEMKAAQAVQNLKLHCTSMVAQTARAVVADVLSQYRLG